MPVIEEEEYELQINIQKDEIKSRIKTQESQIIEEIPDEKINVNVAILNIRNRTQMNEINKSCNIS